MNCMDIKSLEQKLKALNCLDEVMTSSDKDWLRMITSGMDDKMRWYIIDNGSGDQLMILFNETGVLLKGFDHENELNQFIADERKVAFFDKMFAGIPKELLNLINDDERDYTTFCMWYINETGKWYQNEYEGNDGGKEYLLGYIPDNAEALREWAEEYYEETFNKTVMEKIFETSELSDEDRSILVL